MQTHLKLNFFAMLTTRHRCLLAVCVVALAQTLSAQIPPKRWNAQWIASVDGPARDYDVVYFRKTLKLPEVPSHFLVDVSADTRFELHVNGKRIGAGPALGDVRHWRYETYDLAPYLKGGDNVVAAVVWNFGTSAAVAQMSSQTAFLLSAEDPMHAAIDTDATWRTSHEAGRTLGHIGTKEYYAAGPAEIMDGTKMNWGWDRADEADWSRWLSAKPLGNAAPRGAQDGPTRWILQKDDLPSMKYEPVTAGQVVRANGIPQGQHSLEQPLEIPAHAHVTVLLDRGALTTAFPSLEVEGGLNASVDLTYAEALYDSNGQKGNRNDIKGRHIQGLQDHVVLDGQARTYQPLWWRTWRYLQVEVKTTDQPLTIRHLGAFYTAYPFSALAHFESNEPELAKIWDVGWRTAQLCAHETYMDTPYWEQLQYVGDTRIQALISYAVTGDDRLARQALMAYRDSLLTDGLTQSRYPSSLTQVIPPFSLLWVSMLHDHWMYHNDAAFDQDLLPGTRGVLDWFSKRQRPDGLLGRIEWWPFVDWSPPLYTDGVPPQEVDGGSSAITLQYIEGLRDAADLEDQGGEKERASRYRERADRASKGLMRLNWDEQAGLLADTPAKKTYSQQANSLAVWLDVIPVARQRLVMNKVLASSEGSSGQGSQITQMAQASYYFRFYVAKAMVHVGLDDEYIPQLDPWNKMLDLGLSTWAETPEPTRSDSHAWSAHPTLDLLTIVAGIAPGSPGFETVTITPHLGRLQRAAATMPTPKGLVKVRYTKQKDQWKAGIILPAGLSGQLSWHDRLIPLRPGDQEITLP